MKLDYSILWFEDKSDWLEPVQEILELKMDDLGFRLFVDNQANGENLPQLVSDPKIDLILMDFDLQKTGGKDVNGDELIRQIRHDHKVLTEVVFYSVSKMNVLRDALYKSRTSDGVYYFNRDTDISTNIMRVIETTIKKVMDTNNMRGLAMASVANCDRHVIDAIATRWGQLQGDSKSAIREKVLDKLVSMQTSLSEDVGKMQTEEDVRKILSSHGYPSKSRFNVLNSVTRSKRKCPEVGPQREVAQGYSDLLDHRNRLGHARAIEKDGKVVFEGHENISYGDAEFGKLRQEMIACEDALKELLNLIAAGKLD
ncbi:response regulator [Kiloniella majae]|uniref:response regulator n=1 Tax=Kiloniella majae TaxID=1938558 RepID=UPI000A2783CB|nr:response regulator [Kiloniella majae]